MSSQICLKWNSFLSNIATSFESLWEEEGLVDVTLASDGQCLTAHKVILSASSPFFKKVFQVSFFDNLQLRSLLEVARRALRTASFSRRRVTVRSSSRPQFLTCYVILDTRRVVMLLRDNTVTHLTAVKRFTRRFASRLETAFYVNRFWIDLE